MVLPVALSLAASLLHAAELELAWGARAEARSSSVGTELTSTSGRDWTLARQEALVAPRAAATASFAALRLGAEYAPRIWSNDLSARPSPLVNHVATATVETARDADRPVELGASVTGVRGRTDPIDDALRAQATGVNTTQLASPRPMPFEQLRAIARTRVTDGQRDTLEAEASWAVSRATAAEDRERLPVQRELSARLRETHLLTERVTLAVEARAARSVTDAATAQATGDTAAATLTGTWRATLATELWAGAGAAFLRTRSTADTVQREVRPVGTLGALTGTGSDLTISASATATTMFDRFTGEAVPIVEGLATLRWSLRPTVALAVTGSGSSRTDGVSTVGTGDLRVIWNLRDRTLLEAGTVARWQRDGRVERPSFAQISAFVSVTYGSDLVFGREERVPGVPGVPGMPGIPGATGEPARGSDPGVDR
jgi:hypothetical protein